MKKILIVEDESVFLQILRSKLKSRGYDVSYATDGDEALEKFKRVKPDMILLDLLLPRKSGIDVLKALRKQKNTVPVIVLTNVDEHLEIETLRPLNINGYFLKTETPLERLLQAVEKVVPVDDPAN